jgi:hypothetical protein
MTITATPIAHEDTSLRTMTCTYNGRVTATLTVADDPDTDKTYCIPCDAFITPVIEATVLNDEEWVADDKAESLCPLCLEPDLARDDYEAEEIRDDRAQDDEAEYRHDRDRERVRGW